jgi:hypothetical protein
MISAASQVRERRRCAGVLKRVANEPNKQPLNCPGWAHKGSQYCFLHDPQVTREERRAIAAKGGRAGLGTIRRRFKRPEDVLPALGRSINALEMMAAMDPDPQFEFKLCRAVAAIMRIHLRGLELSRVREATATSKGTQTWS